MSYLQKEIQAGKPVNEEQSQYGSPKLVHCTYYIRKKVTLWSKKWVGTVQCADAEGIPSNPLLLVFMTV